MSTAIERFWAKVDKGDGCWTWRGHKNPKGYSRACIARRYYQAHRIAYELLIGPIPAGLVLDHLCRNRGCVNPAHCEPVTNRENLLRGDTLPARALGRTHCKAGHPYAENMTICIDGSRGCKACWRRRGAAARQRARLLTDAPREPQ